MVINLSSSLQAPEDSIVRGTYIYVYVYCNYIFSTSYDPICAFSVTIFTLLESPFAAMLEEFMHLHSWTDTQDGNLSTKQLDMSCGSITIVQVLLWFPCPPHYYLLYLPVPAAMSRQQAAYLPLY